MKKVAKVGFWLLALSGFVAGHTAWAKPADLPAHHQIECDDGTDDPPSKGTTLKAETVTEEPADTLTIDSLMPAFIEQWLQHVGDMLARPDRAVNLETLRNMLPHFGLNPTAAELPPPEPPLDKCVAERARELFKVAEYYRRAGQLESARFYYQRVHLTAPTSAAGQKAIDRLQEVEERMRNDAEEENNPGHKNEHSMDHDVYKDLILLGLVRQMV